MVLTMFGPQFIHFKCYLSLSIFNLRQPCVLTELALVIILPYFIPFCFSDPSFLSLEFTNCSLLFSVRKRVSGGSSAVPSIPGGCGWGEG